MTFEGILGQRIGILRRKCVEQDFLPAPVKAVLPVPHEQLQISAEKTGK
jgi:hypothetical protein